MDVICVASDGCWRNDALFHFLISGSRAFWQITAHVLFELMERGEVVHRRGE